MKFDSLRDFIDTCERMGELRGVDGADWDLEIGAISELVAERKGPALLFDHIKGYPPGYRVVTNAFITAGRTALVHDLSPDLTPMEMLKAYREKVRTFKPVPPVEVGKAPVKENILTGKDVDLFRLPTPKWHEHDGGRYIGTGSCVITRDPDTGWVNVGTYRCMLQDKDLMNVKANVGKHARLAMDKYHAKGESCPIAVSFGHDPALFAASCDLTVKANISEYDFAGWLRGAPVVVTKGEITDLPIPATAEIVVEGEVPPPPFEERVEGPFGEWTGYFTDVTRGAIPLMKVKAILHRDNPIMLGVPPFKPPIPYDFVFPKAAVGVWDQIESADIPGVTGVWFLTGTMLPNVLVISIKQQYAGHAKQAAVVGAGCRAGSNGGRVVIVVDDDVDITNAQDVMWAVGFRSRAEDADIVRGLWTGPADPMMKAADRAINNVTSGRIIINACRPWDRLKEFPPVNRFSPEYRARILNKWTDIFGQQ